MCAFRHWCRLGSTFDCVESSPKRQWAVRSFIISPWTFAPGLAWPVFARDDMFISHSCKDHAIIILGWTSFSTDSTFVWACWCSINSDICNIVFYSFWIKSQGELWALIRNVRCEEHLARLSACTSAQDISRPCRLDHTYKMNQFWPSILTKIGKFHQALLLANHGGGKELR